jgi:proteasome lid subunit RPN8/RPN11
MTICATTAETLPERLQLPDDVRRAIHAHAESCAPNECCGLLASDPEGRLRFAYPLTNTQPSPVSYTIDPDEHFGALCHAEDRGWEVSGVFHSHPNGPATPSAIDIRGALDPAWVYLIAGRGQIRGYRIRRGATEEIQLG